MKLIKRANKSYSLKTHRKEWLMLGMLKGWLPTTVSAAKDKQKSIFKIAQTTEVTDADVMTAIRDSISFAYPNAFVLKLNDEIVDESAATEAIVNAFIQIAQRDQQFNDQLKAYIAAGKPFSLGVYYASENKKNYLVPTFGGFGVTNLKSEFTGALYPMEVAAPPMRRTKDYGDVDIKGVDNVYDIVEMVNAAGFIAQNGIMNIGSIGSRKTNWDTSYNLHMSGVSSGLLQQVLTWFTDISNQDIRNIMKTDVSETFDLTQAKEVHALMSRLGLEKIFMDTVKAIKDFEDKKGLKAKHKRLGHIPDYQKNTKIVSVPLADYTDTIFVNLREKISKHPRYMKLLAEKGVQDVEEILNVAFTMGRGGDLVSAQEAADLIEMAA